ncbi:hypothetical protein BV25DRAFT_1825457 [Artomyces pyxidatus]|uniref:Uncharacterized protein n=1 Tax=Artomyces pyxidatus TaxID=48021 RepID=A0ACB8T1V9_9AGAM|nr:hypothetical protein BV25DRAFT_1825457 [Artomyces pyxidatus]
MVKRYCLAYGCRVSTTDTDVDPLNTLVDNLIDALNTYRTAVAPASTSDSVDVTAPPITSDSAAPTTSAPVVADSTSPLPVTVDADSSASPPDAGVDTLSSLASAGVVDPPAGSSPDLEA